jgi:hypothetical protein
VVLRTAITTKLEESVIGITYTVKECTKNSTLKQKWTHNRFQRILADLKGDRKTYVSVQILSGYENQ